MTPEENQRLDAIERRLDELTAQIARLTSAAGNAMPNFPPRAAAGNSGTGYEIPHFLSAPMPRQENVPPAAEQAVEDGVTAADSRAFRLEAAVGITWISRIAVVTVVLALAFFFEYAFENHWITESGRILLGLACSAAALAAGERLWRGGQRAYGQSLTAAGIAFFHLSIWAAFSVYHLIGQPLAFSAMVLATAAAGVLALRYDSAAVALLGLAGGYATPLLLGSEGSAWFVLSYALILDACAVWAARLRGWRWLERLAVAGTAILYLSQPPARGNTPFVLAYYALIAAAGQSAAALAAAQLLAGAALVTVWTPGLVGLLLAWCVAGAGLAAAGRRQWPMLAPAAMAGFWLAYGMWVSNGETASAFPILSGAFLMFLGWPVWRVRRSKLPLQWWDLLMMALNTTFYFGASYSLLQGSYSSFEGLLAVGVAAAQMGAGWMLRGRDAKGERLSAGIAGAMLVLAAPIQFAGYRVTLAWALEGAALVWLGERLRALAGLVFLMVLARLAWVDSGMYGDPARYFPVFNARMLTFAVVAAALWASAWWVRRGKPALVSYTAGHAVMLWGLGLEAVGWAARTAGASNFNSVASTSLSILAGVYAVLLVAGGTAARSSVTRMLGIGLIGLVVLKLYLYDVWQLGQFYRMAAFAILGVLLLVVSYVYSRRRTAGE